MCVELVHTTRMISMKSCPLYKYQLEIVGSWMFYWMWSRVYIIFEHLRRKLGLEKPQSTLFMVRMVDHIKV
jgi:hypothetical protein